MNNRYNLIIDITSPALKYSLQYSRRTMEEIDEIELSIRDRMDGKNIECFIYNLYENSKRVFPVSLLQSSVVTFTRKYTL